MSNVRPLTNPRGPGRKAELLATLDAVRGVVETGDVAGLVVIALHRDSTTTQWDDSRGCGSQWVMGALDYLKLKIGLGIFAREMPAKYMPKPEAGEQAKPTPSVANGTASPIDETGAPATAATPDPGKSIGGPIPPS